MKVSKIVQVMFLGSYGCGKTSLIRRYFSDVLTEFELKDGPTLETTRYFKTKEQHPMGLNNTELSCYDPCHSFDILSEMSSSVMDAYVVCADATDEQSVKTALLYLNMLVLLHADDKLRKRPTYIFCLTKWDDTTKLRSHVGIHGAVANLGLSIPVVCTSAKDDFHCDVLFNEHIRSRLGAWFD